MAMKKLVVEVVEARNLLPKDGTGTSSPYVVVDYDGQRKKTRTVHRELNPRWEEALEFEAGGEEEALEVDVYHDRKVGPSRRNNFLGRLRLDSGQIVRKGEEALVHFPLQKKSFFSWVSGDLGLKIYYTEVAAEEKVVVVGDAEKAEELPEPDPQVEQKPDPAPHPPPEQPPSDAAPVTSDEPDSTLATAAITPPPPDEAPPQAEAVPPPPQEHTKQPPPPPPPKTSSCQTRPTPEPPIERSSFDLVDKVHYLFIRIVRARSLPSTITTSTLRVRISALGRHVCTFPARVGPSSYEWDETFAFFLPRAAAADSPLEITVSDSLDLPTSEVAGDSRFLGRLRLDIAETPLREPPDSPLATQWYTLEGDGACRAELMLATWMGTQADVAFHRARLVEGHVDNEVNSRSMVYMSPKLWYLRVTILEAHDLPVVTAAIPVCVRVNLGFQVLRTRPAMATGANGLPSWNEDLIFVAAEPFSDLKMHVLIESGHGKDNTALGTAVITVSTVERRVDDHLVATRWVALDPPEKGKGVVTGGRLHVRLCLDGGYNVADEPPYAMSDYRPSARQLWKRPIGTVEIGIIRCKGLLPVRTVQGRGTADAYVVVKYGPKWARTRTLFNTLEPTWNEQYTWDIYDPATVITVGVFDDTSSRPIGRVRIRITTLDDRRPYRKMYPLLLPLQGGMKKMGELELVVRFTRTITWLDLLHLYSLPTHPVMHLNCPIPAAHREPLRYAAARIVAARLSLAEPPLRREVVMYLLDAESPPRFSFRKVRANWKRLAACLTWVDDMAGWVRNITTWHNPFATVMVHMVVVVLVLFPDLVVPALALHVAVMGMWRYRRRPRGPGEPRGENATAEEMDEEMDAIPSTRGYEVIHARYDRLRAVGLRLQELLGDLAAQAERVESLMSWRDPRASAIFITACLLISVVLYIAPTKVVAIGVAFYHLRHPVLRERRPPAVLNFFRRLPSLAERYV